MVSWNSLDKNKTKIKRKVTEFGKEDWDPGHTEKKWAWCYVKINDIHWFHISERGLVPDTNVYQPVYMQLHMYNQLAKTLKYILSFNKRMISLLDIFYF